MALQQLAMGWGKRLKNYFTIIIKCNKVDYASFLTYHRAYIQVSNVVAYSKKDLND
jgi:hypothetical protein